MHVSTSVQASVLPRRPSSYRSIVQPELEYLPNMHPQPPQQSTVDKKRGKTTYRFRVVVEYL